MKKVVLRADGSASIGFGHIYRLLALANILKNQFHITFVSCNVEDFIKQEICRICDELVELMVESPSVTADQISLQGEMDFDLDEIIKGDEIVILDGYQFRENYQQKVKERHCELICIDDLALGHFYGDIIINHAPGLDNERYQKESYSKVYSGLSYAILRNEFFKPLLFHKEQDSDVLISLGGSDYYGFTEKLVSMLFSNKEFATFHIVYTSSYSTTMIEQILSLESTPNKIKLYKNLSSNEVVDLMDKCTYAFVSASTVLIEAYARGLNCFTGYYTQNQRFIYDGFVKEKKAIGMGDFHEINEPVLQLALQRKREIIALREPLNSAENLLNLIKEL